MSPEYLGLFDTPYERRHVRVCLVIVGLLAAAALLILPVRNDPVGQIDAFIPMVNAFMFLAGLVTAALLYAQASVFRSRSLTVLASGYVFAALLLIPHTLSFPGVFSADGLLGAEVNTTGWLANFRRLALPVTIIFYVLLRRADAAGQSETERPPAKVASSVLWAVALAAIATLLATIGHDLLPQFFINRLSLANTYTVAVESAVLVIFVVSTVMLFRARSSVLDVWLLVAQSAWVIQSLVVLTLQARFTVGWYGLYLMTVTAHLVVMIALLVESHRLYARLALSTSVRNRDRDARLMSMDAVAATISQEVGQPLAAMMLSVRGGLDSLTRQQPDPDRAIQSLRDALDAGQDAFDVVKGIRAPFSTEPNSTADLDLNDLVRETVSVMGRELTGKKILLRVDRDEALPRVLANRVQLQRVLVNLFSNAIESLEATRGRPRRLTVRTATAEGGCALLEISDNGVGIPPGQLRHVFDAFFTTKAKSTGLGLSLSRTIVEEHGGRLWASAGEEHGATFHMQIPPTGRSLPLDFELPIDPETRPAAPDADS